MKPMTGKLYGNIIEGALGSNASKGVAGLWWCSPWRDALNPIAAEKMPGASQEWEGPKGFGLPAASTARRSP